MSTRSKFERQLGFRHIGFSIKIPDVGRSFKPFDYVVGVPLQIMGVNTLRFVAIEAKSATGWTLRGDAILSHQETALNMVEGFAKYSSWIAISFLDIPKMKFDHNRKRISGTRKAEAYLMWWEDIRAIRGDTGIIRYEDIERDYGHCAMMYTNVGSGYRWVPEPYGHFYQKIASNV